jgi:ATP-dependent helicase/nuclease subunit A
MVMLSHDFLADGQPVAIQTFVRIACDPGRSVIVEACAGSGKTWLLVARMLRLLLAGAEPAALLAITFTRKAAQEMRERLLALLSDLALQDDSTVLNLLIERGLDEAAALASLPTARGLYQRVLSGPGGMSVDTFHSWFARLLQIAPLSSGVPHGYALEDKTTELQEAAWLRLMQLLKQPIHADIRAALVSVYQLAGSSNGKALIDAFMARRAEWWVARESGDPLDGLEALCGEDAILDARLSLWQDTDLLARIAAVASLLGKGGASNQKRATEIEQALTMGEGVAGFDALLQAFFTGAGKPRSNTMTKALLPALDATGGEAGFTQEWLALCEALMQRQLRSAEPQVWQLNVALMAIGEAYVEQYQAIKAERRVFDFADLEWQAWRLLTSPVHAAYLHARLDARYQHILLDEFQDTNPLQWHVVRAWLDAYDGQSQTPSVFIVGDPKQSIYRFRRAEPRVFEAARSLLQASGAADLRTNLTRRNGSAIVDVLNAAMQGNRLYQPQTTLSAAPAGVWRLPLIPLAQTAPAASAEGFVLRDPLTVFPLEEEDLRHQQEGFAVGQAILQARAAFAGDANLSWSDVMILVRSRTHLAAYERGLREAGVPFVSSRRGGLLDALEVADMLALLRWLTMPADNQSLAHALKSPVFGAADTDLMLLSLRSEASWWQRLQALQQQGQASAALDRAATLLAQWQRLGAQLPVHDLLDKIFHDAELIRRYAEASPAAMRGPVLGNLDAFIALALAMDAGRYPSVARFVDRCRRLQRGSDAEAPDEADIDATVDAVRIMTIHGAKGLEAAVVVVMGANHSDAGQDVLGVLCDWPGDAVAPTHFSVFGKNAERGLARQALFAQEENFRLQENWNLLYVAATRAKQCLIISGTHSGRAAQAVTAGSWYERLLAVAEWDGARTAANDEMATATDFQLSVFYPPLLPPAVLAKPADEESAATLEGSLLHALMERLTAGAWPILLPDAAVIAQWMPCTTDLAQTIAGQAQTILSQATLEKFFNPAQHRYARNEMEMLFDGEILRLDRLVMFEDDLWVLDYKRHYFAHQHADYQQQMARYQRACETLFPNQRVRTALITVDGKLWEMDGSSAAMEAV